jgi:hypothetical protein
MPTIGIRTFGEIFGNYLLEVVADPRRKDALMFFVIKPEKMTLEKTPSVPDGETERIYLVPSDVDASLLHSVRFPRVIRPYGTAEELFHSMCGVVRKYTVLTELQAALVVFAAMATWLPERSQVPVCVALIGPRSDERQQLLKLVHCFFRRPLHLAECTLSELRSLPPTLNPALLIEHCEDLLQLRKILRATSSRDAHLISNGRAVSVHCSKVICLEGSWSASLPDWSAIEIALPRAEGALPVLDDQTQEQIANEFQAKLMMYRRQNYDRPSAASVQDVGPPALSSLSAEIARALDPCFSGEPTLQGLLRNTLRSYDELVGKPTEGQLQSTTTEALLRACHESSTAKLHLNAITKQLNGILEQQGETLQLDRRAVKKLVRGMGLEFQPRDATGEYVLLLNANRERIHKMAWDSKVLDSNFGSGCSECEDRQNELIEAIG